jgi:hypothetical protein
VNSIVEFSFAKKSSNLPPGSTKLPCVVELTISFPSPKKWPRLWYSVVPTFSVPWSSTEYA